MAEIVKCIFISCVNPAVVLIFFFFFSFFFFSPSLEKKVYVQVLTV